MARKEPTNVVTASDEQERKIYVRPVTHRTLKEYAASLDTSMVDVADTMIRDALAKAGRPVPVPA